jgi:tripartite-type tricarboxylate transporter receptor subunit TctC
MRQEWAFVSALVLAIMLAVAPGVRAADYPSRPIRLIVPYAAGGPTDLFARLLAEFLGRDLKQSIVVENKGGAQGAIGAETVARAEPDGYTLFATSGSVLLLNPLLYKKLSYDPAKDFRMLALVTAVPVIMCINPSVPAKSVAEFVAYAKQNPGKVNFGSSGTGSFTHLAGEMFKQMAGIEMTHVPYRGAALALQDVMSGNLQLMFESVSLSLPQVRAGKLRALAISSPERIADLPDVPTVAESGYPDYLVSVWNGVAGQAGMPEDVTRVLTESLNRALSDDGMRSAMEKAGYSVFRPLSPAAIAEFVEADRARWSRVIKAQNITLD